MPAQRRFASHRLFVGLLVGLSWVVAVEYLFGYVVARNENNENAAQLLAIAGSWLAVGVFLLLGEFLLSRKRTRAATSAVAEKQPAPSERGRAAGKVEDCGDIAALSLSRPANTPHFTTRARLR